MITTPDIHQPQRRPLVAALAALLLLAASAAQADDDHRRARELVESGDILPLEKVLQAVTQGRNWRLLEAKLEEEDGRLIYEFELLDESGRVRELEYDARTGAYLDEEKGDH